MSRTPRSSKDFANHLPMKPPEPPPDSLDMGITTRIAAKNLLVRRMSEGYDNEMRRLSQMSGSSRRQSMSRGSMVPNSIFAFETKSPEVKTEDPRSGNYVHEIIQKLKDEAERRQIEKEHLQYESERLDEEMYLKIRKELERLNKRDLLEELRKHRLKEDEDYVYTPKTDPTRVSRRTAEVAPISGVRRSTVESIKESIQNSPVIQKLINVSRLNDDDILNEENDDENQPEAKKSEKLLSPKHSITRTPSVKVSEKGRALKKSSRPTSALSIHSGASSIAQRRRSILKQKGSKASLSQKQSKRVSISKTGINIATTSYIDMKIKNKERGVSEERIPTSRYKIVQ